MTKLQLLIALVIVAADCVDAGTARAQTDPSRNPPATDAEMPMADYLALLGRIAPAAEDGARQYLAAFAQRCGRALRTSELRQAFAQGDGDPVLLGLVRASHLQDAAARQQLVQQLRCPDKERR